ncbi:MAG: MBL fold metallo-hydrolase [Gemmatimonadetes bacterium]|nr:MBL fold metallo-hydrolase [Gemmatimonadota bacterium]NIO30213.1 MBL fold metallo-hydrolase [Gemmatimonadota bacterium]
MLLRRFYDDKLAQASYLVGCQATGEALVVDPHRDVECYVRAAEQEGLRITHVTETHIHADYASGTRELAKRTGARMYLSDEGDADWKYEFGIGEGAVALKDGDTFKVGNVLIEALHTPGHTPEHMSFLLTDTAGANEPMGVFTGDFVFVGDVGRPDLLERAAGFEDTMEEAARTLFDSLERFKALPDYLQLWPGHGAGSACGKSLGAVPQSTLGYERMFNWAFALEERADFVAAVLAGQPEPPKYFAEMKRINKAGPRILGGYRRPERLPESRLADLLSSGALVVDTRKTEDFAAGHLPGAISIPLDRSFTTWAGWLIPYDREFYLIVEDEAGVDEAARDLMLIGLDRIGGYFGAAAIATWEGNGRKLAKMAEISSDELAARVSANDVAVIDVRGSVEWEAFHIPGAANIPLGYLSERLDELPREGTVVLHCQEGWRSGIGASLLEARGITNVANLKGGIRAWVADGRPVDRSGAGGG